MRLANYFFYYSYVGLVAVAGFWGAFVYPEFDFRLLFKLETETLSEFQRINLLSQYRFLRAIELGFGLFAILFVKSIFSKKPMNRLFIFIMSAGVLARIISMVAEGVPSGLMLLFLAWELAGVVVISIYSQNLIRQNVIS
jgi:hypothetical protein